MITIMIDTLPGSYCYSRYPIKNNVLHEYLVQAQLR